jgi:starvation-inducible outer membrane lipoprotein
MRGLLIVVACCAQVSACSPSVFPYKALDGVNQDFDFAGWQLLQEPHPQQKVQLGGRIVQAEMKDDMVTITATQLAIPSMSRRRTNQVVSSSSSIALSLIPSFFVRETSSLL